jgi:hypothetical protein
MVAVKYKYPNETEVVINNADNYEIEIVPLVITQWQAFGTYFDALANEARIFRTFARDIPVNSGSIVGEPIINPYRDNGLWYVQLSNGAKRALESTGLLASSINNLVPPDVQKDRRVHPLSIPYPVLEGAVGNALAKTKKGQSVWDILDWVTSAPTIVVWFPIAGKIGTTLRIFQGLNQVFVRTEPYEPEYVEVIDGCPPNTCPVLCGNGVCCYNSNGISVSSYQY